MTITTARNGAVLSLTLHRPEGNRLDAKLLEELCAHLRTVDSGPDETAVVVIRADGRDFSLGRERNPDAPQGPKAITAEFELVQQTNEMLSDCSAVTISALQGRAEGAGLSLAARCDIVLVADNARLSFPEIPHGIPPTIVLSHYRYVLPPNILGDLIFTGRELNGTEAVQFGLAARHVPAERLQPLADELASQVASYDLDSIALVKRFLKMTRSISREDASETGIALYAVEMADRALRAAERPTTTTSRSPNPTR